MPSQLLYSYSVQKSPDRQVARRSLLEPLAQEGDCPGPGFAGGLQVRAVALRLRAQETVARALVDVRLVSLAEPLHLRFGRRDGRVHASVVAAVEPED